MTQTTLPVQTGDGHRFELIAVEPPAARRAVLWLPALGVAARHYLPLAQALAARGDAVYLHEWRGHGSSGLRASRQSDWGYRELLDHDLAAADAAVRQRTRAALTVGGHSLGGQLAACHAALGRAPVAGLWLVASGSPYWRSFPRPLRHALPLAYRFLPWLASRRGALPGRRIGFGGNEARGVMHDWSRTALSGRYAVQGWKVDIEGALAGMRAPVSAVTLARDWLAPRGSLDYLLSKMPHAPTRVTCMDAHALGAPADHFAWMATPEAVIDALHAARD